MKAIILAGGFGTRLQSVIPDVPKPMAPINGKPFLAYLVRYLQQQGITEIIFSVHYRHEAICDYFKKGFEDIPIRYVLEQEPLGTGGAIAYLLKTLNSKSPLIVINGDTFVKLNYQMLYQQHLVSHTPLTMALQHVENCDRYGEVLVENGIITAFKDRGQSIPGHINAGVYVLSPTIVNYFPAQPVFSFEKDFLHPMLPILKPSAFVTHDYFVDIGVPEDYQRAIHNLSFLESF